MDFDPRDYDSRDEDRAPTRDRGGRGGSDRDDERDDEWSRPAAFSRDRDDEARALGRGPGDARESQSAGRGPDARDVARWPERERDEGTRHTDPREVFARHVNLPRGLERELVRTATASTSCVARSHAHWRPSVRFEWSPVVISGTITADPRTLAQVTFGIFANRVSWRPCACPATGSRQSRSRRKAGAFSRAIETATRATARRLQRRKTRARAGTRRQVYRAYERHAERLEARGARIERVILDYEPKREYQKWLHERDKDRDDYAGHPDRTADEIREWALEHDLP